MLNPLYSWPPLEHVAKPDSSAHSHSDSASLTYSSIFLQVPAATPSLDALPPTRSALPLLSNAAGAHTHNEAVDGAQSMKVHVTIVLGSVTPKPNYLNLSKETNDDEGSGPNQWSTPEPSSIPFIDQDSMTTGQLLKKLAVEQPEPLIGNVTLSPGSSEPAYVFENGLGNDRTLFARSPEPSIMGLVTTNHQDPMKVDDAGNANKGEKMTLFMF